MVEVVVTTRVVEWVVDAAVEEICSALETVSTCDEVVATVVADERVDSGRVVVKVDVVKCDVSNRVVVCG